MLLVLNIIPKTIQQKVTHQREKTLKQYKTVKTNHKKLFS